MKRLTGRAPDGTAYLYNMGGTNAAIDRLAAYEGTGLEPEEISIRRWIPVTERVPGIDDGDWVLGVVNGFVCGTIYKNAIVTVEYDEDSGCWYLHDASKQMLTITHWMPLPQPPKEDKDNA